VSFWTKSAAGCPTACTSVMGFATVPTETADFSRLGAEAFVVVD
jgi:hypothetical protein